MKTDPSLSMYADAYIYIYTCVCVYVYTHTHIHAKACLSSLPSMSKSQGQAFARPGPPAREMRSRSAGRSGLWSWDATILIDR